MRYAGLYCAVICYLSAAVPPFLPPIVHSPLQISGVFVFGLAFHVWVGPSKICLSSTVTMQTLHYKHVLHSYAKHRHRRPYKQSDPAPWCIYYVSQQWQLWGTNSPTPPPSWPRATASCGPWTAPASDASCPKPPSRSASCTRIYRRTSPCSRPWIPTRGWTWLTPSRPEARCLPLSESEESEMLT